MRTLIDALRSRHRAVRDGGDRGVTLVETVVAMTIMTVFGGIFTGAVIAMTNAASKAEATTRSADALNQAYLSLDKVARYASAISTPGVGAGGSWYVELRATHSGVETCTQLRIDKATQQLQKRTWTVGDGSAPTAFVPLASGISNGDAVASSADQPFVLPASGGTATAQRLSVTLASVSGNGSTATTSQSSFSFTAVNSTSATPAGSICQQAGRP